MEGGSSSGSTPDSNPGLSRTLKRSGVKFYAKCSNHKHLHRVLSQIKDVVGDSKTLSSSYALTMKDMEKWASKEEYGAYGDVFTGIAEIASYQIEVQREQMEIWSEFRKVFESLLDSQRNVEDKREKIEELEGKETKLKKELKKRSGSKNFSSGDLNALTAKLQAQEEETKTAQSSVSTLARENESIKLLQTKNGLLKLFDGLLEANEKSAIILKAQKRLSEALPEVPDTAMNLNELPYEGSVHTTRIVLNAKEQIKNYRPGAVEAPPSYSPHAPFNPYFPPNAPGTSNDNNNSYANSPPGGLYPPIAPNMESAFQKMGVSSYN
eukprot:TRINITY_DN5119_c0_g1_i1.p1 TRINITY_DN5119_c0_g1~~TRINITY_DN5119_c0_g1_i1.p1  ORF type:complete len:355 (+),score=110.15 TRINITY_DN5119_c0_g1_i1:96-1067(+)